MGSDPEEEGQGRTACTPGPGCSEAGEACGAEEVYGLHAGGCAADVPSPALEVARRGADALAAVSTELADVLGWLVHDPGRLGDASELEELGRTYRQLRRDVDRLSPLLAALRT